MLLMTLYLGVLYEMTPLKLYDPLLTSHTYYFQHSDISSHINPLDVLKPASIRPVNELDSWKSHVQIYDSKLWLTDFIS